MFDPYTRKSKPRQVSTRTFKDGGDEITLTFQPPRQIDRCAALDHASELIKTFIGTPEAPGSGWPPIGGEAVDVTPTAVQNAALYAVMQPKDVQERYTTEQFVAFQVVLDFETWMQIAQFGQEVIAGAPVPIHGSGSETSCEPRSDTPKSTPTK